MTATTSSPSSLIEAGPVSRPNVEGVGWARSAAIAGFAFVVLNVAGSLAPGAPPASNASAAKVAAYFADHSGAIKAQLLLGGIGIAALMWWLGGLWRLMSRAEGDRPASRSSPRSRWLPASRLHWCRVSRRQPPPSEPRTSTRRTCSTRCRSSRCRRPASGSVSRSSPPACWRFVRSSSRAGPATSAGSPRSRSSSVVSARSPTAVP